MPATSGRYWYAWSRTSPPPQKSCRCAAGAEAFVGHVATTLMRAEKAPVPVELDRVSYQYPGARAWAVAEVSLAVQPGSFLAVVGPNGSGKSTLVRLLAGRLSPTLGTVRRAGDPGLRTARRHLHDLPEAGEPGARGAGA